MSIAGNSRPCIPTAAPILSASAQSFGDALRSAHPLRPTQPVLRLMPGTFPTFSGGTLLLGESDAPTGIMGRTSVVKTLHHPDSPLPCAIGCAPWLAPRRLTTVV